MKKWWLNEHEVIMRLDALSEQLRESPKAIIRKDGFDAKRLNIIGKAIGCLTDCLRYLEDEAYKENLNNLTEEDMRWYSAAMSYWFNILEKKED